MDVKKRPKEVLSAKPIHGITRKQKQVKREIWATICYYYPQYTLKEASELSARDISLLMKIANKIEAQRMYTLTQIVAAPHTKNGRGVKDLTSTFKKAMEK